MALTELEVRNVDIIGQRPRESSRFIDRGNRGRGPTPSEVVVRDEDGIVVEAHFLVIREIPEIRSQVPRLV